MTVRLPIDHYDLPAEEVRQRIRWARRQGNPAWLWPDISVAEWSAALDRIAAAIRVALGEAPRSRLSGKPDVLSLAAYTSGMGPLLGWWLEQGQIDAEEDVAAVVHLHLEHNRRLPVAMTEASAEIVRDLYRRNVRTAVLKGAHTAHAYFPDPSCRPASDVDLLVAGEDVRAAEAELRSRGLVEVCRSGDESSWRLAAAPAEPRSLMLAHGENPWSIDLHGSLDILVSRGAPVVRFDLADPMSSSLPWAPAPEAVVLEQPLLLLHLAVHSGSGLQNLTLLRLVELHLVIRKDEASGLLDWDALLAMGRDLGCLRYAYPALRFCEELLPGSVPDRVLRECREEVPPAVSRVLDGLSPANAQRVARSSVREHFMWASGIRGWLRQVEADLAGAPSWAARKAIYERRGWQLIRGGFSR